MGSNSAIEPSLGTLRKETTGPKSWRLWPSMAGIFAEFGWDISWCSDEQEAYFSACPAFPHPSRRRTPSVSAGRLACLASCGWDKAGGSSRAGYRGPTITSHQRVPPVVVGKGSR
jgi:hypothetical protein